MRDIASFTALNRFGMGAGPGDADGIGSDPRGWVLAQTRLAPEVPPLLAGFRSSAAMIAAVFAARFDGPEARAAAQRAANEQEFRPELLARAAQMVTTSTPLIERLVLFWSNHFTVSTDRRATGFAVAAYEREAIRPHVLGRFEDMLAAVVHHPCMLVYLDNPNSAGPNSPAGIRRRASRGTATTLNENLAREVMELHTLGVDGGYAQEDVIELALALTGWSHGGYRRGGDEAVHGRFQFVHRQHEPGARRLLGRSYAEGGAGQAASMLRDLARHPATARHLATKLARHFIADDPAGDAVDRLARVFADSNGDLAEVTRALVAMDAAWADPLAKVKSHHDYLIAVHRAGGHVTPNPRSYFAPLRLLARMPFAAPSPQGWGDRAEDWVTPEALMIRVEWVHQFAVHLPATLEPQRVLEESIGAVARDVTRTWMARAPSPDTALTMIFASPEFQRR